MVRVRVTVTVSVKGRVRVRKQPYPGDQYYTHASLLENEVRLELGLRLGSWLGLGLGLGNNPFRAASIMRMHACMKTKLGKDYGDGGG